MADEPKGTKIPEDIGASLPLPPAREAQVKLLALNFLKGALPFVYFPMRSMLRYFAYAEPLRNQYSVNKPSSYHPIYGLQNVQSESVTTVDNETIEVWHKIKDKNAPTIVYCHGNASNLSSSGGIFSDAGSAGYNVVVFDYRGYGNSTGSPSEQGLYRDGEAVMAWLKKQGLASENIILLGESLGSGVATHIAYKNPDIGALVLKAPFSSLQRRVPLLARPFASDDVFDSATKIKYINSPVLIIHDEGDPIIGAHHSERLLHKGGDNIVYCRVLGSGHDIPNSITLEKMREFLPSVFTPIKTIQPDKNPPNLPNTKSHLERVLSKRQSDDIDPSHTPS